MKPLALIMLALVACDADSATYDQLCVNGHPARRAANVTYAGLPPRHGYERDHFIPLCLGGTDTPDNVWYQPIIEARQKDHDEWIACEAYCRDPTTLQKDLKFILDRWQR